MKVDYLTKPVLSSSMLPRTLYRKKNAKPLYSRRQLLHNHPRVSTCWQQNPAVDSNKVDIDNYIFQWFFLNQRAGRRKKWGWNKRANSCTNNSCTSSKSGFTEFYSSQTKELRNNFLLYIFLSASLITHCSNQVISCWTGGGAIYYNPGLNGFFKLGISDLMEDFRITGGFKLAGDLNSNEYFWAMKISRNVLINRFFLSSGSFASWVWSQAALPWITIPG